MAVQFLIAVQAALLVASVHREALPDNSPAVAAPCIPRATSPEALPERPGPALASSALVLAAHVPVLAAHVPEWVVRPDSFHLRVKRRVRSARAARSVAVASNIQRPRKAR